LNGALFAAITAARQRHSVDQLEVTLLINPPFHRTVLLLYREVRAVPPAMVETIGMPTLVAALLYEEAAFVPRGDA
jgi:hypothetical protein